MWNLALWPQAKAHAFPRQQLCQLHAPAIYMPLPSVFQASKATTLTATCPCHLFFRGFKTTVCPASNPPNPSAGLQGNNSYSYMPLPSVFQGVQDCRLPTLKPSKRFRRPPREQLVQLHAPALCFSVGSRLPFARPQTLQTLPQPSKATTLTATSPCHLFFRGSRLLFARPQTLQTLPQVQDCRLPALKPSKRFRRPPRQQLLQLHAPALCFSAVSRLPFARPQTLQTLPQASKATTLTATCPCHLFFRGFKTAVCPPSNIPNASAGLQGNNSYSYMPLPSVFQRVQDCRLPGLKPSKPFRRPPRQQLLQLHAPAICFSGGSRLPFARPQTLQTLPQASKATTLTATCPCPLFFSGFKTAVCPASNPPNPSAGLQGNNSYSYMPLPSVFQGVQDCRLPALKPSKRFRRPPRQQLLQLHAPALCFSAGSRLPFARPQTLQTLPQASKATTLTATCPCHLFFRGFKTAVCPPSNPPNASAGLQGNNSYSYMPLPSVFQRVQDCRLPALKPSKRFRKPPRQQLLQLHAPAICVSAGSRLPFAPATLPSAFSGGSRLPFARPQTLQMLPQASKATTLTATCPCHLFFSGFKTAVCPASNPPNASAGLHGNNSYSYMPLPSVFQRVQDCRLPGLKPSKPFRRFKTAVCPPSNPPNASAGLQGNNSYSYMPLPSVFQRVQDCRLPALKPSKRFRRPPRQQLLQLHAPALCFSAGSRLPFARPQTLQTLPQASKATTLTATCPCHLYFSGFKTAVCPASNPPNASAGLQGSNSYSYMPLPSAFSAGSRLPFARPQTLQTLPQASKATTLTATCPCHLFFRGFKTAVCPPSNPPNASAGLQGNRLLQLHAPALCFSAGPPNASAGLQGNNSYSYMPLPSVFQRVQDCRLPGLKPSKRFRRPPRQQLLQLHAPAICFFRGFKTAVCPASNHPNPSAGLQGNN